MARREPLYPMPFSTSRADPGGAALRLNAKEVVFVNHYVRTGNAPEAYELAYGRKGKGTRQLANPDVQSEIIRLQDLACTAAALDRGFVLERMMTLARMAMGEIPHMVETLDQEGNIVVKQGTRGVNMSEARQILTQLGKVDELGLFVERQQVDHEINFAAMTDDELRALALELETSLAADGITTRAADVARANDAAPTTGPARKGSKRT